MSTAPAGLSASDPGPVLTIAAVWQGAAASAIGDELLAWPPDLFAFTDVILERVEMFRFAPVWPRLESAWRSKT